MVRVSFLLHKGSDYKLKINIHGGHNPASKTACGAVGLLNESTEDRLISAEIQRILQANGHTVYNCTVDNGTSQNDVLKKIVAKCNAHTVDYDISIHLNSGRNDYSGDGSQGGFEVWLKNTNNGKGELAQKIRRNMSALGFKDRGTKQTNNLYFLNHTNSPAILLEICFVDDRDDYNLYQKVGYKAIAKTIAEAITGSVLNSGSTSQSSTPSASTIYRVRKSWTDAASQIGAYGSLENAKVACKVGYTVYDANGNAVYTNGGTATTSSTPKPAQSNKLVLTVDGSWGVNTTKRLQQIFNTGVVDGKISNQWKCYSAKNPGLLSATFEWHDKPNGKGSMLIKKMQAWAGMSASSCDGEIGTNTIKAFQRKMGTSADGVVSKTSSMVKALQKWCNNQ